MFLLGLLILININLLILSRHKKLCLLDPHALLELSILLLLLLLLLLFIYLFITPKQQNNTRT